VLILQASGFKPLDTALQNQHPKGFDLSDPNTEAGCDPSFGTVIKGGQTLLLKELGYDRNQADI
jgi:hypothetical protein